MTSPVETGIENLADALREQLPGGMVVTEPSAITALVRPWNAAVEADTLRPPSGVITQAAELRVEQSH
jgi:hypothetical protein